MKINTSQAKVDEAMNKIRSEGGAVNKSGTSKGSISIRGVKANFVFDPLVHILTINIMSIPWLVSKSFVESEIKKFFS